MGTEGGLVYFLQTGAGGGGSSPIACFQCIETRRTSFWKFLLETSFSRPDLFLEISYWSGVLGEGTWTL